MTDGEKTAMLIPFTKSIFVCIIILNKSRGAMEKQQIFSNLNVADLLIVIALSISKSKKRKIKKIIGPATEQCVCVCWCHVSCDKFTELK